MVETAFDLVGSSVLRIHVVDERVDVEVVFFPSHIGERRGLVNFGR